MAPLKSNVLVWLSCLLLPIGYAVAGPNPPQGGPPSGGHHGGGGGGPQHFGGHDFNHFSPGDQEMWRGGGWRHDYHDGRYGWWWSVGDAWYFYDQPVYPYPLAVSDVYYGEPETSSVVVEQPTTPVAPPPQFKYYCDNPAGYYPAVPNCPTEYRKIAVQK